MQARTNTYLTYGIKYIKENRKTMKNGDDSTEFPTSYPGAKSFEIIFTNISMRSGLTALHNDQISAVN